MAADLPKEFDVIVLGSGMPESIVAAAFSRIGQSVLHLDRNEYYSGDWASFSLQGIEKWALQQMGEGSTEERSVDLKRPSVDEKTLLEEGESLVELPLQNHNFTNADLQFHACEPSETSVDETSKSESKDDSVVKCSAEEPDISQLSNEAASKDHNAVQDVTSIESGDSDRVKSKELSETDQSNIGDGSETHTAEIVAAVKVTETSNLEISETETGSCKTDKTSNANEIGEILDKSNNRIQNEDQSADKMIDDSGVVLGNTDASSKTCDNDMNKPDQNQEKEIETENTGEVDADSKETGPKIWTEKALREEWRRFNLDLSPKVLYCGGEMVELLISSDIAKYCEFKTVTRVLTVIDGKVEKVPCSRADVFSSKKVSMLEKRMLMKFLQFCLQYESQTEDITEFLDRPFTEFLSARKLTANLKHFVQHSIAMATDSMTTKEGLERTQKFLKSVGRYGNTAFLWSLYGSGELPQSYCRMCAVFGGTYCLRMSASSVILDKENKCKGIVTTEGQRIACKWLIMESSYAPKSFLLQGDDRFLSRAIIVADKALLHSESQELSMLCLPCPDDGDRPVLVLELPPGSMACPPDLYVFHLTRQNKDKVLPKEDLAYALDILFQKNSGEDENMDKPKLLWSVYFTQKDNSSIKISDEVPENVFLLQGPGIEVDIDGPVQEARELFKKILPEEEFLPKAPNPEDIIYVDDTEAKVSEDSSQSEFGTQDSNQSQTSKGSSQSELQTQDSDQSQVKTKDIDQAQNSQSESGEQKCDQSQQSKDSNLLQSFEQETDQSLSDTESQDS